MSDLNNLQQENKEIVTKNIVLFDGAQYVYSNDFETINIKDKLGLCFRKNA